MFDFAKEMDFDEKTSGNKSNRDRSLINLLKSPGRPVSASGISSSHKKKSFSKTKTSSSNANELCERLKLLPQKKTSC